MASVPLDEFAADIESQPCSRNLRGSRILRSYEPPENTGLLPGGNTDALITDREEHDRWRALFTQGQLDRSPLRAVLDSIAKQVAEDLLNAGTINLCHQGRERGV